MTDILQRLSNFYSDSATFTSEVKTALLAWYQNPPNFLIDNKWEFIKLDNVFMMIYNQYKDRFSRYREKSDFQHFLLVTLIDNLYDFWLKTNWLNDNNIMEYLKDIKTRGQFVRQNTGQINSPFPLDTKFIDSDSVRYLKDEPIQSKTQSLADTDSYDVIGDIERVRGDLLKGTISEFLEPFSVLFISNYGIRLM